MTDLFPPKGAILDEVTIDLILERVKNGEEVKLYAVRDYGKQLVCIRPTGKFEDSRGPMFDSTTVSCDPSEHGATYWDRNESFPMVIEHITDPTHTFFYLFENYWDAYAFMTKVRAQKKEA